MAIRLLRMTRAEFVAELERAAAENPVLRASSATVADEAGGVTPDVCVVITDGRLEVLDNAHGRPELEIDEALARCMLADPGQAASAEEMLSNAQWLIRAGAQRSKAIVRLAEGIVREQAGFFETEGHLRPLTAGDLAQTLGLEEATVAFMVHGKYLRCARGMFEFAYFLPHAVP